MIYQYFVLTTSEVSRVDEFRKWYDEEHLRDVVAVPGVVRASRFDIVHADPVDLPEIPWHSFAIYEIEADDDAGADEVLARITKSWYDGEMVESDLLRKEPILTMLAKAAGRYPAG